MSFIFENEQSKVEFKVSHIIKNPKKQPEVKERKSKSTQVDVKIKKLNQPPEIKEKST